MTERPREKLPEKRQLPNGEFATYMPNGRIYRDADFIFAPRIKLRDILLFERKKESPMHRPRFRISSNEIIAKFLK